MSTTARWEVTSIPRHLLPAIGTHLAGHVDPSPEALLFTGEKGGLLRVHVLQTAWGRARRAIGRPELHLHDLRHAGNTWAAATGASTAELMARMGHASPVAALRYQHATAERDRAVAEALSKLAMPAPIVPIREVARDRRAMDPQNGPFQTDRQEARKCPPTRCFI